MKRYSILLFAAFIFVFLSCAGPQERKTEGLESSVEIDPKTIEVLRKINSVSAYEVPDLGLRQDKNYAKTAQDV